MALDRYQFTKTDQDKYRTTRYPKLPKQQSDLYVISREGDRLDLLANEFYKDPRYWWVLAEANNVGKGTMIVPSGLQLRIPFPITDLLDRLREVEENK
jgi:nucleoid-associated protein YgaU